MCKSDFTNFLAKKHEISLDFKFTFVPGEKKEKRVTLLSQLFSELKKRNADFEFDILFLAKTKQNWNFDYTNFFAKNKTVNCIVTV